MNFWKPPITARVDEMEKRNLNSDFSAYLAEKHEH